MIMPVATAAGAASITVTWDAVPDPDVVGYRVYVGTRPGLYAGAYDVGDRTFFTYEGHEGQRYYFAVASYAAGPRVGPLSAEVSGVAGAFGPAAATSAPQVVGYTRGLVTSMTALPDGRLLAIEDGQRVLITDVVAHDFLSDPALILNDPSQLQRLDQIVVGPDFSSSKTVYVSRIEARGDGRSELRITRYREVHNQLGEAAVVLAGLTLPSSGAPVFAADASGHLYVALPSPPGSFGQGRDLYQGKILRFQDDGSVPPDSRAGSPIFAEGFEAPLALIWSGTRNEILMAGQGAGAERVISRLDLAASEATGWPRVPAPLDDTDIESADVTQVLGRWRVERYGEPTAIAVGSGDSLYVAFRAPTTTWPGTSILRFDLGASEPIVNRLLLLAWGARQHRR